MIDFIGFLFSWVPDLLYCLVGVALYIGWIGYCYPDEDWDRMWKYTPGPPEMPDVFNPDPEPEKLYSVYRYPDDGEKTSIHRTDAVGRYRRDSFQ